MNHSHTSGAGKRIRDLTREEVLALQSGSEDALNILIERLGLPLRGLISRFNVPEPDALYWKIVFHIFQKAKQFKFDSKFSSWVYRVATSQCGMELRSSKKRRALLGALDEDCQKAMLHVSGGDSPLELLHIKQVLSRLASSATPDSFEVLVARLRYGPNEELCKALNISMAAVKSRLYRLRRAVEKVVDRMDRSYYVQDAEEKSVANL